jgi:hypothetical protein
MTRQVVELNFADLLMEPNLQRKINLSFSLLDFEVRKISYIYFLLLWLQKKERTDLNPQDLKQDLLANFKPTHFHLNRCFPK